MSSLHKGAKDLFLAALERQGAERAAFLADACGDDVALRKEVESLLAFHDEQSDITGAAPAVEAAAEARRVFEPGFVFAGRYRMITRLGRGGMGDIWLADDLMLETPVALKLIRSTSRTGREQLLNEVRLARQITHPAVCRVFDVGEADDEVFFTMEYVKGQDLSALLHTAGRLSPAKVTDIARQLCGGLAAAHATGVLHRDLKPANILIDDAGHVRITDFGIAVTAEGARRHPMAGTPLYMAPEQRVAGATLSPQTDLYALGLVLYELATGEHPFKHAGRGATLLPPSASAPDLDPALDSVILRALATDPKDRPRSAEAFAFALPRPSTSGRATGMWPGRARAMLRHPLLWAAAAAVAITAATFVRPMGGGGLTQTDTIVLADFVNTTDEPLFGPALKVALAVALEQSPYLKVFSDDQMRETLQLMERPPDTPITRQVAREIAQREQLKALISGSIASLGHNYVLALEASNALNGDVMAREQVEAASKEQVLTALGTTATRLREKLGESLTSIRRFDVPLPKATTPSLEALNAYALALEEGRLTVRVQAIPHLQRAIELDPEFAMAQALLAGIYANTGQTELAPAFAKRAYELRDRVSERERFFISWRYYRDVLQVWNQGLELARRWTAAYPREAFAFNSLGIAAQTLGNLDEALPALQEALRLEPTFAPAHANVVDVLLSLHRFDEAKEAVKRAEMLGVYSRGVHRVGYLLAFLDGNATEMARHFGAASRTQGAIGTGDWQARLTAFSGRMRLAHEEFRRAIQQALSPELKEFAAQFSLSEAEGNASVGRCAQAHEGITAALGWSRDSDTLDSASRLLAWCGDGPAFTTLTAELEKRFQPSALRVRASIPVSTAALAIRQGNAARGITLLQSVEVYDRSAAAKLWPAYLKGQAHLLRNEYALAGAAFQNVIDYRGELPDSLLYPMALLGRARAAAGSNDVAAAIRHYEMLLAVWKDADADLEPLQEARREYARLRSRSAAS
jgi:tetratricopeptide (TPR) repeat protein